MPNVNSRPLKAGDRKLRRLLMRKNSFATQHSALARHTLREAADGAVRLYYTVARHDADIRILVQRVASRPARFRIPRLRGHPLIRPCLAARDFQARQIYFLFEFRQIFILYNDFFGWIQRRCGFFNFFRYFRSSTSFGLPAASFILTRSFRDAK